MARATVLTTSVAKNVFTADAAGTAIDATDFHALPAGSFPLDTVILRVTNTTAGAKNVTIKAGDNPPADAAGQGDLVTAFGAGNVTPVVKFITFESARFLQSDGTVHIDVEAGTTGFISAWRIPR